MGGDPRNTLSFLQNFLQNFLLNIHCLLFTSENKFKNKTSCEKSVKTILVGNNYKTRGCESVINSITEATCFENFLRLNKKRF